MNALKIELCIKIRILRVLPTLHMTCFHTDLEYAVDFQHMHAVSHVQEDRPHTFVEIDHEIISTVILLPSAESFKKGCCQLQAKVCARRTG